MLPICLDGSQRADSAKKLNVVGWGKATNAELGDIEDFKSLGISQRTLQKLEVPLVGFARCRAFFGKITRRHLCAGGVEGEAWSNVGLLAPS